ncbi:YlbG family protein [Paenibacillus campi]|uniref:YlbG family protein n=1 Tax=Paenibacillus campi TaxID=3106031 RepID=UPI002AFEA230|nr:MULTISPECIES: YlbG family protein [unclassified Paenibacillus]
MEAHVDAADNHPLKEEATFPERIGYIIWVSDLKAARNLEKYGCVHYISRRMHYVVMYVNAEREPDIVKNMSRLSYVRKVERSYRNEIKTEYSKKVPDPTQFFGI